MILESRHISTSLNEIIFSSTCTTSIGKTVLSNDAFSIFKYLKYTISDSIILGIRSIEVQYRYKAAAHLGMYIVPKLA